MKQMLLALMLGVAAAPALAQNPQSAEPHRPPPPLAPTPVAPPEKMAPPATGGAAGGTTSGVPGSTLSDQLSKDRGTIAPPNVDPGMTVHPGGRGSAAMPVIPPPGTPGGNPSVVPK